MDTPEAAAEREVLIILVSQMQSLQDPRNKKRRLELVVPAAQWEKRLTERLEELTPSNGEVAA